MLVADLMSQDQIQAFLAGLNDENNIKTIKKVAFPQLSKYSSAVEMRQFKNINDVKANISIELGKTKLTIKEILALEEGSVFALNKVAGEAVEIYINNHYFGIGEIVVINEVLGVRVNQIFSEDNN